MVEKLIIKDDKYSLYLILTANHEDWINFRVRTIRKTGFPVKRSRLAYSRSQRRLSETTSTKRFREKSPDDLQRVIALMEMAIQNGLV